MSVFALILAIESVLLIPSAQRFEEVEIEREMNRIHLTIEPALMLGPGLAGEGPLARDLATLLAQNNLQGLVVHAPNGQLLAGVGPAAAMLTTRPTLAHEAEPGKSRAEISGRDQLLTQWRSGGAGTPTVTALSDIKHVRQELYAYLLRIGGLILLIVLVVTVGTMLVLYRQFLRPLLQLRTSAVAAGATPSAASQHRVVHQRRDELGDLIDAHNAMLAHVSESMAREATAAREREHFVSRHDAITGLPNRVALMDYLEQVEQSADRGGQIGFFLIQFHDAALSNRELPQRARDLLLNKAAARDFIAQLGPLHFAVVKNRGRYDSAQFAESIVHADQDSRAAGAEAEFDVHIGIVEAPIASLARDLLLHQAEFALEGARAGNTLRYHFFDVTAAAQAQARHTLTRDLKRALAEGELTVWYQPKVNLGGGDALSGAEALVRWNHPVRGMVSPAEFIPIAEANGLIQDIDRTVLRAVCRQISRWRIDTGRSPRIAVNLSASHFASPTLADELQEMVFAANIFATDIEIEITETAAMQSSDATAATLKQLRALGFQTAIDDFGTGYSSLSYLQRFAVDTLKIDRSFVETIGQAEQGGAICSAVLKLGHALGSRVVAEGIETEGQATFLRELGCDYAQGYWFGKPLPADAFTEKWLPARAK